MPSKTGSLRLSSLAPQVSAQRRSKPGKIAILIALALVLFFTAGPAGLNFGTLSVGLPRLWNTTRSFLTWPDWGYFPSIAMGMLETVEMAFVGTLVALPFCLIFGLLAARNMSFHPAVAAVFRGIIAIGRALPFFVTAMVLVSMVGLGFMPGILALIISSVVAGGKLFADSFENCDKGLVEAVAASGGGPLAQRRYGIFSQSLPELGSQALLLFDQNVQMAIAVGIVGAGGIGYAFSMALRSVRYDEALLILLSVLGTVALLERISRGIREWLRS